MIPAKLKKGDEVRVIAPARSLRILSDDAINLAAERLSQMGLKVTFGKNVRAIDEFNSSSIEQRIEDLHEAFSDKNVKGILTVIGGFNSNQLLDYIDYDLIKRNPKIICGFSDITALANAIYAKTGIVTYSGTHFSTYGMLKGIEYSIEYFKKSLMSEGEIEVLPSEYWSDDCWWANQEKREFINNEGFTIINEGIAEGVSLGGNLCTFNLLQGTEYMPSMKDSILFIEDDDFVGSSFKYEFDRDLQSTIHQEAFKGVRGILIGRCKKKSEMTIDIMRRIIKTKRELNDIPVIYGVDFGHTTPIITFPIGGKVKLSAVGKDVGLQILEH